MRLAGRGRTVRRRHFSAPRSGYTAEVLDFDRFPAGLLIQRGLEDLAAGRETQAALLVQVGGPRLRRLGLSVPQSKHRHVEHALYLMLEREDPGPAHSRYNALIRALVSFERAVECAA